MRKNNYDLKFNMVTILCYLCIPYLKGESRYTGYPN